MKKLIYCAAALATALFAGSCQRELLDPAQSGSTVTFTVEIPEVAATKAGAIGDDASMINDLVYAVYRTTADTYEDAIKNWETATQFLYAENSNTNTRFADGKDVVSVELINNQNHIVLLWAQHADTWVDEQGNEIDLTEITYPEDLSVLTAKPDMYAAFSGYKFIPAGDKNNSEAIRLHRPFAQVNIATKNPNNFVVGVAGTVATVRGAGETFNVASQKAEGNADVEYTWTGKVSNAAFDLDLDSNGQIDNSEIFQHYVAMNYVFANGTVSVDYEITTANHGTITNTINNVPVEKNYRTNLVGSLLTSDVKYNVVLDKDWSTPSHDYELVRSVAELAAIFEELNDVNSTVDKAEVALGADMDLSELFNLGASTYATKAGETAPLPIVIPEGKTVVLNLNGYNVTVPEQSEGKHYYAFDNYGTLTIHSSTGKGAILSRGIYNHGTMTLEAGAIYAIDGNGGYAVLCQQGSTFVMNGGSIIANNEDGDAPTNGYDATTLRVESGATAVINDGIINNISNYTFAIDNDGDVTVNNGTFTSIHSTVSSYGTLTINGGTFTCNGLEGVTAHALVAWDGSETTINGGSFNGKDNYNGFNVDAGEGAVVNITGGEFLPVHSGSLYGKGTINVAGGTFFDNPTDRLAEGYIAVKEGENWVVKQADAAIGETLYANFGDAVKAAQNGETIKLIANKVMIDADKTISVATGKVLNIDLNGKTLYGETDQTGNREMFLVKGTLNVSNGTIEQEHVGTNLGWSAMTTIFDVTAGGVVNLTSVTVKNLGGSDMGFVAHLNNWGEVTLTADNCIFESNYVALRVFNSGYDKNNVTIKNSTLKGGSYALWVHNYSDADFVNDKNTTAEKQKNLLNFNITENNRFIGKNETPFRYGMTDAIYAGLNDVIVWNATELESAVQAGKKMILAKDIEIMKKSIAISNAAFELNGNGKTITMAENCTNDIALFDITGGTASIKNVTFDGIKGGAVVRTVGTEFEADNVTAKNGQHTQAQGLFRLLGKSTVTNCLFKNNNCKFVITLNFDQDENPYDQVVRNCVFEENTCNDTAVLYYVCGNSCTIRDNRFISNCVNSSSNAATVYMGFTENNVVINNLFQDNTVNTTGSSSRVAGGIFFGYETVFTGNAFNGNKVTGESAKGNDVCVSTYYTSIDLSGNYWAGNAPIEDTNYFIQHKSDERKVIINDYLTVNPFN